MRPSIERLEERAVLSVAIWDGGPTATGNDWHDPANWTDDELPGPQSSVTIGPAFANVTVVTSADVAISSLINEAPLRIDGGTFSVDRAATVNHSLTLAGGTLSGAGDVTVNGNLSWTGGTMSGTGRTIIASGGTGRITDVYRIKVLARVLENGGTIHFDGQTLFFGATAEVPGVINNLPNAVFHAEGDGDFDARWSHPEHAFNNAGTFSRGGEGDTEFHGIVFNTTGNVHVQQGALRLLAGNTLDFQDASSFTTQPGTKVTLTGPLTGNTTNATEFAPAGTIIMAGGTPDSPQLLELMSRDVGGFTDRTTGNFEFGTLDLESAYVRLIDLADNAVGTDAEALYVDTLIVRSGSTLDVNLRKVYARVARMDGMVLNGEVSSIAGDLPGDANRDGLFNQLDIVQVLQAAKYLTGKPAVWSEGDWNGDGVFNQRDVVLALATGAYLDVPEIELTTLAGELVLDGISTIDFGTVVQGQAAPSRTFLVTNRGTSNLALATPSLPAGFRVIDGLVSLLAPGATDQLTVRLESVTPGLKSGQLSFGNNDADENPFNFTITGEVLASAPEIEVTTSTGELILDGVSTIDFGTVLQGQTAPSRTFVVANRGTANLTLATPSLPAGFRVIDGLVSFLAPGATDQLTVRLESVTPGVKSGQLSFGNNDADENPFNFTITGEVLASAPEIEVTTSTGELILDGVSTIDFGTVLQGQTAPSRTFVVANRGTANLTLATPSLPAGFRVIDGLVSFLAPGATDQLTVRLESVTPGVKSGQLSFGNNDADENPFNFTITGEVLAPAPEIELTTSTGELVLDGVTTIDFGTVLQGQTAPTRTFVLANRGTANLTLATPSLPVGFRVIDALVSLLAPGATDQLTVRLESITPGLKSGQLSFGNNDADENPFNFTITGEVLAPAPEIELTTSTGELVLDGVSTIDFGTVLQGQAAPTRTFVVTNRGTANLTLGTPSLPVGFRVVDPLVSRLTPGATDQLSVRLENMTPGVKTGQLSFSNNDADENPFNFTITGEVLAPTGAEIEVTTTTGELILDGVSTIDFGTVVEGQTSPTRTFVVINRGAAILTLGTPSLPQGFRVADPLVSRLTPGATDQLTIRLDSTTPGVKSGQLSFSNNDADENPFNFTITGEVLASSAAEIEVTTPTGELILDGISTIDFGTVVQGQAAPTRTFVVTNRGTANLTLGTPSRPLGFRVTEGLVSLLSPGSNDQFTVRLDSITPGAKSGQLSFSNNDADENPFNFTITGEVRASSASEIEVTTPTGELILDGISTIDFGTVVQGQAAPTRTFVVTNRGTANLTLGTPFLPFGFRVTEGLVSLLSPGSNDQFTVRLDSITPGVKAGQLSFSNNDSDENPFNVTLTGQVINALVMGDANGDGRFDQIDLVEVLKHARYLSGESASWTQGDWNLDGVFDQLDIEVLLQEGEYAQDGQATADAVDALFRGFEGGG